MIRQKENFFVIIHCVMVQIVTAQSTGAAEYTDCISAKGKCPRYDIKQYDGEAQAWKIRGIQCTPLLSGPLCPRMVARGRILSIGQIEQTVCKQMIDVKF